MDWTSGLNMEFPIYNEDGTSFNNLVLRKATVDSVVMSLGDKITGDVYYKDNSLVFTMHEYVVYKNVKYALVNPPTIVREGLVRDNSELKGMTKYSFEFYHPMYILNNLPFSDVAVSSDETRYLSENKTFSWIGKPDDFIAKLNKNLEGTEWVVVKSDRFPKDKANTLSQVLQFDKNTIGDALKKAYEEWDIPYVIDSVGQEESYYVNGKRFKVVVGLPSNEIYESDVDKQAGIPFVFKTGQGVGLKNNSRTPRNNKIVTRLSGYGSERNIPYGYPQIVWNGNQNWDYTINNDPNNPLSYLIYKGIVGGRYVKLIKHPFTRTHLMPSIYSQTVFNKVSPYLSNGQENPSYNPAIEIKDYYDAIGSEYPNNINETSPSYEIHEFDTYPQMNDDNAHTRIANAVPLDKNLSPVSDWDDSMDDDGNYIQSYFQITLPLLEFDIYACAAITEEMKINMRSGACIGCTFDVQVDWDDYKKNFYDSDGNFSPDGSQRDTTKYPKSNEKSISVVVKKDNTTFGTLMPNIYKKPNGGDEFVVLGISLPNEYIKNAEKKLDEEMKSYMLENNVYYYDYPLKFDEYFLATHTNILSQLKTNSIVHFDFSGNLLQLFVKQITIKYGNAPLPQYDITLADNIDVVLNQIGKVADDVEHLGSLISMLRQTKQDDNYSLGLAQKLSKVEDDTASGLITFLKGLVSRGNVVVNGLLTAYNAVMNTIKSSNYTGDGFADSGWSITNDYTGSSRAVFDYLYIRKKAVFESLEIKELQFTSGDLAQSLASATIERTDYLQVDEQGEETILGYSDRKIPWTLKGFLMRLSSRKPYALARNKKIRINLKPKDLQNVNRVRCYFLAKDDDKKIFNLWKVDDLARCQTFNIDNIDRETYAGETHKAGNVFWWRLVKGYSTEAVTLDGKEYHYFDVAYGYTEEQKANRTGVRTAWCDLLSDLPAAGDKVVQFGNTSDPARMNIIVSEVNGDGNVDAPSIKSYRGVHTFNTDDCWWGGESCRKMMLSPSSGVEFYAPSFKFITEYGIERTQVERGAWLAIQFEKDKEHQTFPDYSDDILDENGNFVSRSDGSAKRFVRKCRYYDRVEHKGSTWLCTIAESHYWRKYNNGVWSKITEEQYKALPQEEKNKCEEVRNYTTDEPSKASNDWTVSAERGEDGGFKSRVFCRTNTDIRNAKVTGGRYDKPIPTLTKIDNRVVAIEWTDGIPQGTEILWSTVCTFYGDGSNSGWSKPSQETDTETLDIEFSPNATQPDVPVGTAANRNTQEIINARQTQGWYDPSRLPEGQQMVYRAECKIKNGVYETKDGQPAWVISKILGENGKNSVRLDIDNEMDAVQTDSTGVVAAERTVSTVVHLYDGATEVDMVTSSLTTDGNKQKSGNGIKVSWTYNVGSSISDMEKTIKYVYNGVEYSAVFSIVMSKGEAVWQLKPSLSAIPFQRNADNTLTPPSREVGLSLVKIDGGSTATHTSVQTGLTVRYSTSSMPSSASEGTGWSSGNITVANTDNNLYIALFNSSNVLLDRESIPVIKDGEKGTSIREVKPYYAKQSPESYNGNPPQDGWKESIAALGTIAEGWYVWTKNVISFTDNVESTTTYTVSKWGIDGDGIENIETKFYEDSRLLTQQQLAALTEDKWKEYSQLTLTHGDYIYTRTKITYDKASTPTVSYQVNRIGQDGVGYVGTEEYYVLGSSQTDVPTGHPYTGNQPYKKYTAAEWQQIEITGGWSEGRPTYKGNDKKYLWNFEVSFDTDGNVMVTRPICIGNYAKGIVSIVETYAISAYAVAQQAGSYPPDIETWTDEAHDCAPTDEKPYQWNKTVTSYSDGTSDTFYHVSAVKGTRGRGITNTNIYYKADTTTPLTPSGDPSKTDWVDNGNNLITDANANKHLYESTCTTYSDGTYSWTAPIDDGLIRDMAATSEEFALSDSSTTVPTEGWSTSVTPTAGKWLWSRTVLTFKNKKVKYVNTQCVGYCGTDGNGIASITKTYAISAQGTTANDKTPPSDVTSWSQGSPATTDEKPYLWTNEVTQFTNSTTNIIYYPVGKRGDRGIDAQDVEWVYIRTKTNVAPAILNDSTYKDSNGNDYTSDDHLPHVDGNGNIENNNGTYECTDDPKGVNGTWKYEWEIKRSKGAAVNGRRSWNYYKGEMKMHNNLAESAFIIDTDNDNDQFGTDSESKVLVEQTRQTRVSLYDGSAPQTLTSLTATLTYEDNTSVPENVATVVATLSTGIVAVTVKKNNTSNTHEEIRANITAKCSKGAKTITFTIRKVMGGAPGLNPVIYQLVPTQKVFQFSRAKDNTLTPSSRSTQINVAKTEGNTTTILSSAQTGVTYSWGFDESSAAQATNKAVGTTIPISSTQADSHHQVWVELSTGDRETLPIVKDGINGQDGESITKASVDTYRYAIGNSGITPPSSGWSPTKPSSFDKDKWLWTETTIHWSDNSTTVLYSAERNPNDGVQGQDIIVDGSTEMKYYVGSSNTTHPAENSSDWKDLSQVTQTQGKWLWSKATTYYRKADSDAGSKDAGYSVNYNVSYISKDGLAGRGIVSVTEYYKASASASGETAPSDDSGWTTDVNAAMSAWGEKKPYLWNYEKVEYSTGTRYERTAPSVLAIWTKDGAAGKGIDSIVNYYKITNSLTPPSRDDSGWDDDPIAPTAQNPYLYNYEAITWINPLSTSYTSVQMIGHYGHDGISVRAQYSADGTSWHDSFTVTDIWMRTSTDNGTTWSTAMKIVGENGSETDFSFGISQYKTTANAQTAPSDISTWSDAPIAVISAKPYLWAKVEQKDGDGNTNSTTYIRLTGEDGNGITNVNTYFKADTTTPSTPSGAPAQSGWSDDGNSLITNANSSKHLYESTCTTYTNGTYSWTTPLDDGLISDMAATEEEFALADSGTTAPTTGWSSSVTPTSGKWIWSRTKLTFKSGNPKYVSVQCVGYCGTNGNGIVSITRTFAISNIGTTASETTEPSHQGSWTASSPAVTEKYPYLWAKEVVVFTDTTKNTTKYYCIGGRGDNGVDAQDIEWVYIRTKTNTAPTILNDDTYTDTNGKTYTSDDHLPIVSGNTNIENNNSKYQCTDDPKGVTDVWLYEWEIKRTKGAASNGHRSWDYYQGTMTLHNNFAQSAFIIDIDNDNDQFGTDSNSKVLVTQTRSTTVAVYDGATQQTLNSLDAVLTYEDGTPVPTTGENAVATKTANKTTGVVSVTVLQSNTAFSHEAINATITAEVTGKGTKNAVFTIRKVMSGQPGLSPVIYNVNPTSKSFVFNRDASNNLTPSERTSTVNALKTIGNSTQDAKLSDGLTYKWGFDEGSQEGSGTVGNSSSNTISINNTQANAHYQVWVELSTGDRETLPIVKDGAKGAKGEKGEKGDNGADAYTVKVEPSDILFTQSTVKQGYSYPLVEDTKTAVVTVKKGNSNAAVSHNVTIDSYTGCTASASGDTITIRGVIGNYTEGRVNISVAIAGGSSFSLILNVYYNLLGTWKQSVEAGVETIAAEQVSYVINNGDEKKTIEQTRQAFNSVRSAAGSFEQWRTNTTDGYAADQESVNTRINNANQSIQTLSNNVGGLTESVSQIKQTADNINLSVQSGWKNYIANPLAAEAIATRYRYWVYGYSIVNDPVYGKVVQGASYGGDWQVLYDVASDYTDLTGQYVTWFCIVKNRDTSDKYHNINVSITLGGGWYPDTEQNGGASCSHSAVNVRRVNGELVVSSGLGGTSYTSRYSDISTGKQKLNDGWHLCWTTVKLAAGVSIIPGNNLIGFNSTTGQWSIYIAGVVKGKTCPTAESIRTHAGISKAGIDITSGTVNLMAERVKFSYYDTATQTRKGDKIWIDSTTGTLHAVDGDFAGKITATSGTIGGFTIDDTRLYNSNWEAGVDISYGDYRKVKIGKNAAGEIDSEKAIMRAENTQALGGLYNTVLYLNASGAVNNYAFYGKGNGVLDGYVQGFKVYAITNLAGTESSPYQVKLRNGMVQAIVSVDTNENKYLRLPKLGEIRQTLGINVNATTNFTCQLVLINQSAIQSTSHNRDNVWVKGGSHNYSDLITSPDAIPRILRSNDSQDVGLNNANMLIFHITYINKRFIANYILG